MYNVILKYQSIHSDCYTVAAEHLKQERQKIYYKPISLSIIVTPCPKMISAELCCPCGCGQKHFSFKFQFEIYERNHLITHHSPVLCRLIFTNSAYLPYCEDLLEDLSNTLHLGDHPFLSYSASSYCNQDLLTVAISGPNNH